jgi:nuclear transport factor 2 (NTF2) superfamily protein
MSNPELEKFAERYAKAWCSRNPDNVVAFYSKNATISVNDGPATSIAEVARGFMRDFPEMIVTFDKLEDGRPSSCDAVFHWTLTGTHAGSGNYVRISGYELWKIDNDGLIANSLGQFDAADYERQLKGAN